MEIESHQRPHAAVVPLPAQGHINALMHFAQVLAARGFHITFLNVEETHRRMFGQTAPALPNFRFEVVADICMPEGSSGANQIGEIFEVLQKQGPAMEKALRRINSEGPPLTCVVSDSFMACTFVATSNLKLPRVLFWPYCAASAVAQANTKLLIAQGHIPVKAEEVKNPSKLITCLPGIPPLVPKDLRSFYREENSSNLMFRVSVEESEIQNKADWVVVNTFEELEGPDSIRALGKDCPAQAVGPVFLLREQENGAFPGNGIRTSLWEEEEEACIKWLDGREAASVLYVSFGSLALMSKEHIRELAWGLEASGQAFLWVIRPDLVQGDSTALPEGYLHRIRDRGVLVGWAPQLKVLRHPSVGGFLTHNGWNSTIESISMGVPMIGWPYWSEQFLNCRFAKDFWKVGLDLESRADENGLKKADEIEKAVRSLMQGVEGKELRKNAAKLKEAAHKAVMPGGSSSRNIDIFVEHMRNLCQQSQ
uniref:Glycosyltransferase N-terminal domain-containing protein n=1 Tax=Araucaria cunninghamii TaxID=56994 RepID=A0A0D6QYT6_ARACU